MVSARAGLVAGAQAFERLLGDGIGGKIFEVRHNLPVPGTPVCE
jgi:hypothetical protein